MQTQNRRNKRTKGQMDKQTNGQKDKQAKEQTDKRTNIQKKETFLNFYISKVALSAIGIEHFGFNFLS